MKANCAARFIDIARINFREFVAVNFQNFRIAVVGGTACKAQFVLIVKNPAGQAVFVLPKQSFFARRDFDFIKVVPRLIAVVDADINKIGFGLRNGVNRRLHLFGVGQIFGFRNAGTRVRRIDRIDVKIFVAVLVFDE